MSKKIELTRGLDVIVDDTDFAFLNQWKWYAHSNKAGNVYAARGFCRPGERDEKLMVFMHAQIMGTHMVDHINGNGLDNRKVNLRITNASLNLANARKTTRNTSSKYKGVTWSREAQKWIAQINKDRKHFHLGRFATEEEAAMAYDRAAMELYGEFAKPNFVPPALFGDDAT